VEFSVSDNGRGIPSDKHEAIFQPFYFLDTSYDVKAGGSGLGLSITRNLVEMMNGEMRVESEPGKGSTFYFTLPTRATKIK